MGTAQAGIAFRPTTPIVDLPGFVSRIFGETANEIEKPGFREFDTRKQGDILVEIFGDSYFISSNALAWDFLEFQDKDISALYHQLGSPDLFLIFCAYDSGGSHGYAFVENGQRTRTRLQTTGVPRLLPILESGTPKDFETKWLSAEYFYEDEDTPIDEQEKVYFLGNREQLVAESWMTSRLLEEALQQFFGVCPWATSERPNYRYFKLAPATVAAVPVIQTETTNERKEVAAGNKSLWERVKGLVRSDR